MSSHTFYRVVAKMPSSFDSPLIRQRPQTRRGGAAQLILVFPLRAVVAAYYPPPGKHPSESSNASPRPASHLRLVGYQSHHVLPVLSLGTAAPGRESGFGRSLGALVDISWIPDSLPLLHIIFRSSHLARPGSAPSVLYSLLPLPAHLQE